MDTDDDQVEETSRPPSPVLQTLVTVADIHHPPSDDLNRGAQQTGARGRVLTSPRGNRGENDTSRSRHRRTRSRSPRIDNQRIRDKFEQDNRRIREDLALERQRLAVLASQLERGRSRMREAELRSQRQSSGRVYHQSPGRDKHLSPSRERHRDTQRSRSPLRDGHRSLGWDKPRSPEKDIYQSPRGDPYRSPRGDISRSPRGDISRSPRGDISRSPRGDITRSPRGDMTRSPKGELYRSPRGDFFRSPRGDFFRSPRGDIFRNPGGDKHRSREESKHRSPVINNSHPALAAMPRCYMVKKGSVRHDGPPPCSPTEASVAPPCYTPEDCSTHTDQERDGGTIIASNVSRTKASGDWHKTTPTEQEDKPTTGQIQEEIRSSGGAEYAELGAAPVSQRSAADTEAAHELLSLAAGVPPLPPAAVLTVLAPTYTYTIPTNIYIISEESPEPIYHTVQTLAPVHQVEYAAVEPQVNYITYQEGPLPAAPVEYHPIYRDGESQPVAVQVPVLEQVPVSVVEPMSVPVSVIEATPMPVSVIEPVSIQVPVIEMVPHSQQYHPPQEYLSSPEPDVPEDGICLNKEKAGKYDCNECGKRYATSSNLSRHKQTHRSLDSVAAKRCGECGKAYVSMPALAMHVLTHRMGHVCGVCGKQFSRPWLLRGHLRSHTGEKPYSCAACGKAFADRSNLRAHLQTHSSDKKYECLRCNKSFALKSYLNKHQESACVRSDDE